MDTVPRKSYPFRLRMPPHRYDSDKRSYSRLTPDSGVLQRLFLEKSWTIACVSCQGAFASLSPGPPVRPLNSIDSVTCSLRSTKGSGTESTGRSTCRREMIRETKKKSHTFFGSSGDGRSRGISVGVFCLGSTN